MPVPLAPGQPDPAEELRKALKRLLDAVNNIRRGGEIPPPPDLQQIADNTLKVAQALEAGNKAGSVSAAQYSAMGDAFQAIANELRPPKKA